MRYTADQWAVAQSLWEDKVPPKAVTAQTGIPVSALYYRFPGRGAPRVPAHVVARIKTDWDNGMPIAELSRKYGRHRSRFGQLARQHGWRRDVHHPGTDPLAKIQRKTTLLTPQWKRCCGQKIPYVSRCPQCEEPV